MQSGSSSGLLPVIVIPHAVNFYLGDQETYKQILTIYNVYDTAVRFKVLSTNPQKYTVVEPEGSIKPNCSLPIVIRHNDVKPSNCNVTDKFRIQFLEYTTKKVIGKKDITATLNSGVPDQRDDDDITDISRLSDRFSPDLKLLGKDSSRGISGRTRAGPNAFIVFIGFICIIALLMPNEGERSTLPIQISWNMKLVFSYVLGLVTMVIFQS